MSTHIPYSGKLSREKTFAFFAVSESSAKVFSANFVGSDHLYGRTSNPRKCFLRNVSLPPNRGSFLPRKFPTLYGIYLSLVEVCCSSVSRMFSAVPFVWGARHQSLHQCQMPLRGHHRRAICESQHAHTAEDQAYISLRNPENSELRDVFSCA